MNICRGARQRYRRQKKSFYFHPFLHFLMHLVVPFPGYLTNFFHPPLKLASRRLLFCPNLPSRTMATSSLRIPGSSSSISVPVGLFINNVFVNGRGKPITTIDPSTGEGVLPQGVTVAAASREDVDDAVKAARSAFKTTWGLNVTGTERSRLLHNLANVS